MSLRVGRAAGVDAPRVGSWGLAIDLKEAEPDASMPVGTETWIGLLILISASIGGPLKNDGICHDVTVWRHNASRSHRLTRY